MTETYVAVTSSSMIYGNYTPDQITLGVVVVFHLLSCPIPRQLHSFDISSAFNLNYKKGGARIHVSRS
jgi:hypothetical protein